jgi:hypothetical protein
MTHYSDDELAWHALTPNSDIAPHLVECGDCAARYADVQRFDDDLSSVGAWTQPRNLRNTEDVTLPSAEHPAGRLALRLHERRDEAPPSRRVNDLQVAGR